MRGPGEALRYGVRAVSTTCAHRIQVLLSYCLTAQLNSLPWGRIDQVAFRLSVKEGEKENHSLFLVVLTSGEGPGRMVGDQYQYQTDATICFINLDHNIVT